MTHLVDALKQYYIIYIDWEGNLYCGLTLYWYYNKQTMEISIPGHIQNNLLKFQYLNPKNPENAPFRADPEQYGEMCNFSKEEDGTPEISALAINDYNKI